MSSGIRLFLCLLLSLNVLSARAQTTGGSTAVSPSPSPTPAPSTISINPAAQTGQASQKSGSGANNAAGAGLIAAGAAMMSNPPTVPAGVALMAMGMLALAQGSHDDNAAGQSAATAGASSFQNTAKPTYTAPESGVAGVFSTPQGAKAIDAIKAAGGDVTPKGVKMPDGSFQPWSSFGSAGALQAAGFDSKELMKKVAEVEAGIGDGVSVKGMAVRDQEGPGGGSSAPPPGSESSAAPAYANPFAMSAAQRARMLAGKTVDASGEPIGAKGDDLFEMIHRVYDRKRDGRHFILDDTAMADSPKPASRPIPKK